MQITKIFKDICTLAGSFRAVYWTITVGLIVFSGCASTSSYVGRPSPYHAYYKNASFVVPEVSEIRKSGQVREFARPFEEVYEASVDILTQYQGILATHSSSSHVSMLILKAREYKRAPDNSHRVATYGSFFEQWLAVAIMKNSETDITEVALAALNPMGNLINNEASAQLFFSQIQIQLYSRVQWREKFVYEKKPEKKTVSEAAEESLPVSSKKQYKYKELERTLGGWISKSMKEELFAIYCPEVTSWLEEIVDQLKESAGVPDLKTRVTVIPANGLNAFALPNGNIIVSSGLLDSLETADQVAAVLAHELDHLIHHDTVVRLKTKQTGIAAAAGLRTTAAVGDVVVGIMSSVSPAGPVVGALWDVGRAAGRHIAEQGAQHLESALVSNYTADTELRADENGITMLNNAGFNPEANINMLYTLQKNKDKELNKNEIVMFNLVNIKPGIDERIKKLKEVLNKIEKK